MCLNNCFGKWYRAVIKAEVAANVWVSLVACTWTGGTSVWECTCSRPDARLFVYDSHKIKATTFMGVKQVLNVMCSQIHINWAIYKTVIVVLCVLKCTSRIILSTNALRRFARGYCKGLFILRPFVWLLVHWNVM